MKKLSLFADDLTGALDTGVFFSGLDMSISLRPDSEGGIVCLSSRHLSRDEAYDRTYAAVSSAESEHIYLKTDSLLRGHIGAALEAVYKARGTVFFAPAYPAAGRTLRDGVVYVYGARLTETESAHDVRNPIKNDEIAAIIAEESTIPVCVIAPGEAPDPAFSGVIVCNAETDDDLAAAAHSAVSAGIRNFAGCAGFSQAYSAEMSFTSADEEDRISAARLLVVSASANPAALEQLSTARSLGVPGVWVYDGGHSEAVLENAVKKAIRLAKSSPCSLLAAAFSDTHCSKNNNYFRSARVSSEEAAELIVSETAECARRVLARASAVPFVIGGDTLRAFCEKMNIVSITPRKSLSQGVIYCIASDEKGREKPLITKAGSFGIATVILDISDILMPH